MPFPVHSFRSRLRLVDIEQFLHLTLRSALRSIRIAVLLAIPMPFHYIPDAFDTGARSPLDFDFGSAINSNSYPASNSDSGKMLVAYFIQG
ncbi:hypothetical protein EVAR_6581_1 [Eumeta japonica]|uniref:Uncharacterized protein n=1 Tax=Eumeta variegata TaxID=151549 RepID=A0A4C1SQG6_EUMVA|nr:hypothetical protein EVAR_6581_1 [Eumeta japonica]